MVSHRVLPLTGAVLLTLGVVSCSDDAPQSPTEPVSERVSLDQGLDAREVLIRASLDVRGIRPTAEELLQVSADPSSVDTLISGFVDHPGFATRVKAIFAEAVRTRQDFYRFGAYSLGLPEEEELVVQRAIAEEPLNLIAHVAVSDAPFTEILTAEYTVVDDILLEAWPVTPEGQQPDSLPAGTTLARYNDTRPSAGVLSTNSFFWRHTSTVENANRGRTNAIARAFLCEDFLERPIDFPQGVDLTDTEAIDSAIRDNPGCQACHATLDPFASHLWGFMYLSEEVQGWLTYQPQNERMWADETAAEPAFFGAPTSGTLDTLAVEIASDERFVSCAVQRVFEGLMDRDAAIEDEGQLAAHREAFLDSGLSLKELVRSVLNDPAYRGQTRLSDFGATPDGVRRKLVSPELLTSSIADLTGYRLAFARRDATDVDYLVRALAGGSESGPASSPSLGHALVHRRIAEGAARALVDLPLQGQAITTSRVGGLLSGVDKAAAPSPETIALLVREVRSMEVAQDSEDVTSLIALWSAVAAESDADDAWTAVLTAVLADPQLAVY